MILLAALALDLLTGEPRNRWHPVAWLGRVLGLAFGAGPQTGRLAPFLHGALVVIALAGATAWAISAIQAAMIPLGWFGLIVQAWLLKCSFSLRGLVGAARSVERSLASGDLARARAEVGTHLVSRRTETLGPAALASATIESVAENLTDSFLAPIVFYLVFGLPGAWAYRVVNTADAMVGYREGILEYLGKPAARLDDLLNLVPARLAALALVLGAALAGADAARALRVLRRDHARTASPNAGGTMAAMAGALGVVLEKPGAYRLGDGNPPTCRDIGRSLRVLVAAAALTSAVAVAASGLSSWIHA